MALFYLVRHGSNDWVGKALAGRLPGVHLNNAGRLEAERLANALASKGIQKVISSPLERARETAEPLAKKLSLEVEFSDEIIEFDFGDWTGKTIEELNRLPVWKLFNTCRSGTRVPNGETMLEVQTRMANAVERWSSQYSAGCVVLVSHGDPIKALIAHHLGVPLDLAGRIEITPGSYSVLSLEPWGPQVLAINTLPV